MRYYAPALRRACLTKRRGIKTPPFPHQRESPMSRRRKPLLPVYSPPEQIFVRGEGCWIWDDKGDKYLDCIAGIAVNALGHAPPVLQKALTEQAASSGTPRTCSRWRARKHLAAKYVARSFADVVFFTNSRHRGDRRLAEDGAQVSHRQRPARAHRHHRLPRLVPRPLLCGDQRGGQSELCRRLRPAAAGLSCNATFGDLESVKALIGPTTRGHHHRAGARRRRRARGARRNSCAACASSATSTAPCSSSTKCNRAPAAPASCGRTNGRA